MRVPSAALRSLRNVAAGASAVMTLMACYGAAYYEGPVAPADPCEGYDQDANGVNRSEHSAAPVDAMGCRRCVRMRRGP